MKIPYARAVLAGVAVAVLATATPPVASAQENEDTGAETVAETTTPSRTEAPNTDSCPNSLVPPEPSTTSEALAPDATTPTPLPVAVPGNCGIMTAPGYQLPEEIMASAFVVANIDTGEIVAQKDPHGRYRPASLIKGLIGLVAARELPLDRVVTASEESASQIGSSVGIGAGGHYTVHQLLQGLLMGSGNDAAHALAQELGGDAETLRKINELAVELGTTDTVAASYSGLDAPGMSTSAFDMGLLYLQVYQDPVLAEIMKTRTVEFPGYGDYEPYELWNDNGLFMNDPDGIGGKTGYTDDANHTFVGALDRDGERYLAIILDTTTDGGRAWEQAQRLLHAAYDANVTAPVATLTPVTTDAPTPTPLPPTTEQNPPATESASTDYRTASLVLPAAVVLVLIIALVVVLLQARRRGRVRRGDR